MAAIPAANIGTRHTMTWGNRRVEVFTVTGDGSGTTVQSRLGKILFGFVGLNAGSSTSETAGYNPVLSFSGNTVTYAAAPTNTKVHTLFLVGQD